jgi:Glyoxalase-like domain
MGAGENGARVRLRQAVLAARELDSLAAELQQALGLKEPFRDPGVAMFGLANTVFAIGDCFLEIVSPVQPDTAAGRYLDRHGGDAGYMVMFDLEDLEGARRRVERAGVRVVWQMDLPDISGTHLHPADMRGAIVSIDGSRPYGSWRWGGPEWTGEVPAHEAGGLRGVTLAVADPDAVATRWAELLGVARADAQAIGLDGGEVRFTRAASEASEGLVEISLALPAGARAGRDAVEVGGVTLRLADATG